MDDFHQNFINFYSQVRGISNVRFDYMREMFNLKVESFPDDEEVFNIQQTNVLNFQTQTNKPKKNWTDNEKKVLIWLVGKWITLNNQDILSICDSDWNTISNMMPRRDGYKCKQKWLSMLKVPLQKAPWNITEDNLLQTIIYDFGSQNKQNKWSQIATILNKENDQQVHRNGKQCRERWNNHLNPNINRNPWELSEDLDLMCQTKELGKKWALISKRLKVTRSENNVKNRFNCLLRKEKNYRSGRNDEDAIQSEESSSNSDKQNTEEITHEEMKLINILVKKIGLHIQQNEILGQNKTKKEDKDEQQDLVKKVKVETQGDFYKELKQKITNLKNTDSLKLELKDSEVNDDDVSSLIPCLIHKDNNQIYFATPEQLQIYLNKTNETLMQQENYLSNLNSLGSLMYDPKLFRSIVMLQSNEYHQGQSGIYNQRSQANLHFIGNCQTFNSYPYSVALSPYPSQINLANQLLK